MRRSGEANFYRGWSRRVRPPHPPLAKGGRKRGLSAQVCWKPPLGCGRSPHYGLNECSGLPKTSGSSISTQISPKQIRQPASTAWSRRTCRVGGCDIRPRRFLRLGQPRRLRRHRRCFVVRTRCARHGRRRSRSGQREGRQRPRLAIGEPELPAAAQSLVDLNQPCPDFSLRLGKSVLLLHQRLLQ